MHQWLLEYLRIGEEIDTRENEEVPYEYLKRDFSALHQSGTVEITEMNSAY